MSWGTPCFWIPWAQEMCIRDSILDEPGNLAEIELILATTTLLGKLSFQNFTIRINDRRFLKAMAAYSGFAEADYESVLITLDKMDKIGMDGVAAELKENGYAKESVDKYLQLFKEITNDVEGVRSCKEKLKGFLEDEAADSLEMIITSAVSYTHLPWRRSVTMRSTVRRRTIRTRTRLRSSLRRGSRSLTCWPPTQRAGRSACSGARG